MFVYCMRAVVRTHVHWYIFKHSNLPMFIGNRKGLNKYRVRLYIIIIIIF